MKKLTCFVAMVLAAVSAMALTALAFAPRAFAQAASPGAPGVCCIDDPISCIIATEAECALQGGIYGGDNSICGMPFNPLGDCSCGPGVGSCIDPLGNGTPGCELLQCCGIVCQNNPFCCSFEWDAACAALASEFQPCNPTCPWDCEAVPDGAVNVPDLLALLAVWGIFAPGQPCDFDNTNVVNVPDLLALLANWGPCP